MTVAATAWGSSNSYGLSGRQTESVRAKETRDQSFTELLETLSSRSAEIREKVKNGQSEDSVQIGGQSFTSTEWEKLVKNFDRQEENLRQQAEEAAEKAKEEAENQSEVEKREIPQDIV